LMNHGDHHRRIFQDDRHAGLRRDAVAATGNSPMASMSCGLPKR
jgi:hypothetical protein